MLRAALEEGDDEPLRAFHRAAVRLAGPKVGAWEPRWRAGALAAAQRTGEHLAALAAGDAGYLGAGSGTGGGADPAGRLRHVRSPGRVRTAR